VRLAAGNVRFVAWLFYPRPVQLDSGGGKYCSPRCANVVIAPLAHRPEVRARAGATLRANLLAGIVVRSKGPDHPLWQGGPKAYIKRNLANGKIKARNEAYRKAHPEKWREYMARRGRRKIGKLPPGTVAGLLCCKEGAVRYAPSCSVSHTTLIILCRWRKAENTSD